MRVLEGYHHNQGVGTLGFGTPHHLGVAGPQAGAAPRGQGVVPVLHSRQHMLVAVAVVALQPHEACVAVVWDMQVRRVAVGSDSYS